MSGAWITQKRGWEYMECSLSVRVLNTAAQLPSSHEVKPPALKLEPHDQSVLRPWEEY
jgi:hypothetical protein